MADKIDKTDAAWRAQLSEEQYRVTRQKGTEPPFTGAYHDCKEPGTYQCVCCGAALFAAASKFDSGTGWPSFFEPLADDAVATESDSTLGMVRTEALCARCDAHLGHVFPDGPMPSGQRYCMNSVSLELARDEETPPSE